MAYLCVVIAGKGIQGAYLMRFALIVSICILTAPSVWAKGCGDHRPHTYLYNTIDQIEYVRTQSANDLTDLQNSHRQVLGLAGGEVGTRFETLFEAKPYDHGLYCLKVKSVEAVFFARPKIYIASNFGRGSCEYGAVMRHEQKHVNTLKITHNEYTPLYRAHLRSVARDTPVFDPVRVDDIDAQKEQIIEYLSAGLNVYMQGIMEELSSRQQEIDSEEEYQRVMDVCHRWDKKLEDE